jgi:hypothetical protein
MLHTRRALLASLLVAATVSLGYGLAGIPNIELMTFTVFVSGYLLGVRLGIVVGAASSALHSVFNPIGAALPPLLVAQILGFALIGVAGATAGPLVTRLKNRGVAVTLAGILGFLLTLVYDVLTNIGAFYVLTGENAPSNLLKFVVAGLLFMGMHLVWNTGLFLVILVPVLRVLARYRPELTWDES